MTDLTSLRQRILDRKALAEAASQNWHRVGRTIWIKGRAPDENDYMDLSDLYAEDVAFIADRDPAAVIAETTSDLLLLDHLESIPVPNGPTAVRANMLARYPVKGATP